MARHFLLSIDGGGIRGILPACALIKLEQTTGRRTRDIFSFAAGTSTGAIMSAAIAAGIPAERLLDLYLQRGHDIFSPGPPWNKVKRLATGSMYSTDRLRDIIREELGAARAWALNDAPIDVLFTAKRIQDGVPWYFVRDSPRNAKTTGRLNLIDCAVASAAAPTYFAPWTIAANAPGCPVPGTLVDGGVGVTGNPVYQACVEAFWYTDRYTPAETTVVSLGTGRHHELAKTPHSLLGWIEWLVPEMLRSPGEQQTDIVRRHFPNMALHRLEPSLPRDIDMDGVDDMDELVRYGEEFAASIDWAKILVDPPGIAATQAPALRL